MIINKIRDTLNSFDLFPTLVIFRSQGSQQISNPYTGALSIMLYGLVLYLLIDTMISTITLQQITATEVTRINDNTEENIENIVIGIGVQMINLNQMLDIFSVRAFITDQSNNSVSIPVVPCTRSMWAELDESRFYSLNLQSGMCVPKQYAKIYSFGGVSDAKGIYLMLTLCDNATSSVVCKTPAQISTFLTSQRFMACSLYILNAGINPNDPNPIQYTINQKVLWLVFTQLQQIVVQSFLGKFEITTDTSLFPWTTTQKISGYQVSQTIIATLMSLTPISIFAQIFVFGSPNLKIIDRSYGKITEVLGYVGGLFGLVVAFFAVFVSSYNRLRYQLIVGSAAFMAKNAGLSRVENFSFFKYLKYSFYCWCKTLCCCQLEWEDCQAIEVATSEASQQIEISLILDRISHLDRAVSTLINNNLQLLLHLSDTHSIQQVQKRRNILEYYDKFTHAGIYATMQMMEQKVSITTTTTEGSLFFNGLVEPTSIFELKQHPQQQNQNSIKKMLEFVRKYSQKYNISPNTFQLTESEQQIQKQLAEQFYSCDEQTRDKYISKIPLGILYRFVIWRQKVQKQERKSIGKGKKISKSINKDSFHESYSQLEYKQNEEGGKKRKN